MAAAFQIAQEGSRGVDFYALDVVTNTEPVDSQVLLVDNTAPVSGIGFSEPRRIVGGTLVLAKDSVVTVTSADPLTNGVASGLDTLYLTLDGTTTSEGETTSFNLSGGAHTISFLGEDNLGNTEVSVSTNVIVDVLPPVIDLVSPLGGERYVEIRDAIPVRFDVSDNFDSSPASRGYLVREPFGEIVDVRDGEMLDPASLDSGMWKLVVGATDYAGNWSSLESDLFEVVHDTLTPRTDITIGSPVYRVSGSTYITSATDVSLASVDDLVLAGDVEGLGVEGHILFRGRRWICRLWARHSK